MKRIKLLVFLILGVTSTLMTSCTKDNPTIQDPEVSEVKDPEPEDEEPIDSTETKAGVVEFFNQDLTTDDFILVNDAGGNRAYLMDKKAEILHEWTLGNNLGNDAFLLPNGKILASLEADEPTLSFGGQGGKIQIIDKDGTIEWDFHYSSDHYETHHDVEMLPNGNVLAMVWERKTAEEAQAQGSNMTIAVFPEALIEINPATNEIVWEWHAWDHLIQEFDSVKENFGVISDNPQLIHLNYFAEENGDIMHANGISYDATNDLILLSVNFYNEVWVIDHSTTTEEASSHAGGAFDKGGNLIYRFGNPMAYNNPIGETLFHNNHFPNFIEDGKNGEGNLLIFVNRMNDTEQSIVYELQLPENLELKPNFNNEPTVIWSFTHEELYSAKVSGAVRLESGNTLITEGDFGYWEVTDSGEIVWQFKGTGFFWRGYSYSKNHPGVQLLELNEN